MADRKKENRLNIEIQMNNITELLLSYSSVIPNIVAKNKILGSLLLGH